MGNSVVGPQRRLPRRSDMSAIGRASGVSHTLESSGDAYFPRASVLLRGHQASDLGGNQLSHFNSTLGLVEHRVANHPPAQFFA